MSLNERKDLLIILFSLTIVFQLYNWKILLETENFKNGQ
jgi:hypothetical protein